MGRNDGVVLQAMRLRLERAVAQIQEAGERRNATLKI
jgi:hypothetical protein